MPTTLRTSPMTSMVGVSVTMGQTVAPSTTTPAPPIDSGILGAWGGISWHRLSKQGSDKAKVGTAELGQNSSLSFAYIHTII